MRLAFETHMNYIHDIPEAAKRLYGDKLFHLHLKNSAAGLA